MLILMANINTAFSQKTISDIEKYFLEPFFQLATKNNFNQIIEENENGQIIRKWVFNEQGQLTKECDWRESGFSSSLGYSSTTTYKEYNHHYSPNGKTKQIIETKVKDGDTLKTTHLFEYPSKNKTKESCKVKHGNQRDIEFTKLTSFKNGFPDSSIFLMITHIGQGYVESKFKDVFEYDANNNLTTAKSYSSINAFPIFESKELDPYESSVQREYLYDDFNRLYTILEHEYEDDENSKLNREIIFKYHGEDSKIIEAIMNLDFSHSPRKMIFKIEYNDNDTIKMIKANDALFYFRIIEK